MLPVRSHLTAVFDRNGDIRLNFRQIGRGAQRFDDIQNTVTGDVVINVGTAGAIAENLEPFQIVFAPYLINSCMERLSQTELFHNYEDLLTCVPDRWIRVGLFTDSEPVLSVREKERIRTECGAAAVDMEAFTIARYCRQKKMPFLSLKVISDTADSETLLKFKQNLERAVEILGEQLVILVRILQENRERLFRNG